MRLPPGVEFLDHTADVGMALEAPSLETLLHRAALGMLALLRGADDGESAAGDEGDAPAAADGWVELALDAATPAALMADWLRELLFLHDTEHRDYVAAEFGRLDRTGLRARVRTEPASPAVREIKGVTYHGLVIEEAGPGWRGQVIFDV